MECDYPASDHAVTLSFWGEGPQGGEGTLQVFAYDVQKSEIGYGSILLK